MPEPSPGLATAKRKPNLRVTGLERARSDPGASASEQVGTGPR